MGAIHTAEYSDWSFIDVGLATDVTVTSGLKSQVSSDHSDMMLFRTGHTK